MKVVIGVLMSTVLHALLGWQWTLLAGAVVGWWALDHGWAYGAVSVGISWSALVTYTYIVAPQPTMRFFSTMAAFVEGVPMWAIPLVTIAIGVAVGAAGGAVGQALVPILGSRNSAT